MFLTHVDTDRPERGQLLHAVRHPQRLLRGPRADDPGERRGGLRRTRTQFSGTVSAEQVDLFDDVDIIVTYGDQALVDALKADPLLSQIPAVANGAIVLLPDTPAGHRGEPDPAGDLLGARGLRRDARRGS